MRNEMNVLETIMLEKTPAIAVDYLSCIQDKTEDEESDEEEDDDERYCDIFLTICLLFINM